MSADALGVGSVAKGVVGAFGDLLHGGSLGSSLNYGLNTGISDATYGTISNATDDIQHPWQTLQRLPGGVINAAFDPYYGMMHAAGGVIQGVGNLAGSKDVANFGSDVGRYMGNFKQAAFNNPMADLAIAGGVAATGLSGGLAAGAGMTAAGWGLGQLSGDAANSQNQQTYAEQMAANQPGRGPRGPASIMSGPSLGSGGMMGGDTSSNGNGGGSTGGYGTTPNFGGAVGYGNPGYGAGSYGSFRPTEQLNSGLMGRAYGGMGGY